MVLVTEYDSNIRISLQLKGIFSLYHYWAQTEELFSIDFSQSLFSLPLYWGQTELSYMLFARKVLKVSTITDLLILI